MNWLLEFREVIQWRGKHEVVQSYMIVKADTKKGAWDLARGIAANIPAYEECNVTEIEPIPSKVQ